MCSHSHTPTGKPHPSAPLGAGASTSVDLKSTQKHGTRHRRKRRSSVKILRRSITMNDRKSNTIDGPELELELKLSPPRDVGPNSPGSESPRSSCVSSELDEESGEAAMVVVGCQRCMMYAMVAEEGGRCPRCKTSVLLAIVKDSPVKKRS